MEALNVLALIQVQMQLISHGEIILPVLQVVIFLEAQHLVMLKALGFLPVVPIQ